MELGRPNLEEFASTLVDLAQENRDLIVVTGDSRGSGKLWPFAKAYPDQIVEIGIAEQNLVGISAGLASTGKRVFAVSPASFLTTRALEQIKNDVAYSDNPVKLVGISAGVSYGALGSTHHSLHDFAALRAINNLDIVAPADNFETREAIKASVSHPRPIYLRFGKKPLHHLHTPDTQFQIGEALTIKAGDDITFVAIGEPVGRALMAAQILEEEGISCRVISMHSLRPFDHATLLDAAHHSRAMVTIEEHSIFGGLGEASAAILLQHGIRLPFKIIGIPDEYTVTGSQFEIFDHYGINATALANTARQLLQAEPVK
ncbi:MAG: transketolase family protein [Chloroflexi bacterium]|nr:transketolase family protein [Chloroflexota bacterium]